MTDRPPCLGERLTALIDGELDHDARDKALAHLACCDTCRAEAASLRALKRRLNCLGGPAASTDLLIRLYAMGNATPGAHLRMPDPSAELLRRLSGTALPKPAPLDPSPFAPGFTVADSRLRSLYAPAAPAEPRAASAHPADAPAEDFLRRLFALGDDETAPEPATPAVDGPSDEVLRRITGIDDSPVWRVPPASGVPSAGSSPGQEPSAALMQRLLALADEEPPAAPRRPKDNRPGGPGRSRRIPRARYLVAGAATLAALGAGTASLSGGGARVPSPAAPSYAPVYADQPAHQARLPRRELTRRTEKH
ncbi:zf-HC2 domain-containing protein [Actinocorallia longicatena]|uniref:Zinc finger protein n=1 Tax=Actinocorallia longicatena TaxID=111803 RepID=A0ABP6QL38_9ACTN